MIDAWIDAEPIERTPHDAEREPLLAERLASRIAGLRAYDLATIVLVVALIFVALFTYKDYAVSNDESVQYHYAELIIRYYNSGLRDQSVFHFQNLFLYGGLFDLVAVGLSHLIPLDPYDLRHILCALIGIGGIAVAAATARLIAGSRAGFIAAIALSVSGVWYGTMFNHTKDVPFAVAMVAATFFLIRIARSLPTPRPADVAAFGLVAGAALGIRVLGLLLVFYAALAIAFYSPRPWLGRGRALRRFAIQSAVRLLPAFVLAYLIMIVVWPWSALAPLNPIRGLCAFSAFHYEIRTLLAGKVYMMGSVPRTYVPTYIVIRLPLLTLLGAALGMLALLPWPIAGLTQVRRKDLALVSVTAIFPVACEVIAHGPAFTGLRHFLFVVPALAILAGVGLDATVSAIASRRQTVAVGALALAGAGFILNAVTLVRLHPYEYLYYNSIVGGLAGASRRYDLDYWFDSMPEAIRLLEAYLRRTEPANSSGRPLRVYSVAVCGERPSFDKTVTLPQLRWDFMPRWDQSQFFLAPTNMNCDRDLDGKVIGTVKRLGVVIAYVKDRRALTRAVAAASP